MWRVTLALIWTISLGAICCDLQTRLYEPQYSQDYNEERKKLELPIIPDHWKIAGLSSEHVIWRDPESGKKLEHRIPFHASKRVDYKSGTLQWEEDRYYGVEDYVDANGDFQREVLIIGYEYQVDDDQSGWYINYKYNDGRERFTTNPRRYSLEEAEQILREWGIERLNYE